MLQVLTTLIYIIMLYRVANVVISVENLKFICSSNTFYTPFRIVHIPHNQKIP